MERHEPREARSAIHGEEEIKKVIERTPCSEGSGSEGEKRGQKSSNRVQKGKARGVENNKSTVRRNVFDEAAS